MYESLDKNVRLHVACQRALRGYLDPLAVAEALPEILAAAIEHARGDDDTGQAFVWLRNALRRAGLLQDKEGVGDG